MLYLTNCTKKEKKGVVYESRKVGVKPLAERVCEDKCKRLQLKYQRIFLCKFAEKLVYIYFFLYKMYMSRYN